MALHKQMVNRKMVDWNRLESTMIHIYGQKHRDSDDLRVAMLFYLSVHGPDRPTALYSIIQVPNMFFKNILSGLVKDDLVHARSVRQVDLHERILQNRRHVQMVEISNKGRKYLHIMEKLGALIEKPAPDLAALDNQMSLRKYGFTSVMHRNGQGKGGGRPKTK